jgi:glycogen operon protein
MAIPELGQRGDPLVDDSFLLAFNAHHEPITFTVPDTVYGDSWLVQLDTSDDQVGIVSVFDDATTLEPGLEFKVTERSIVVLRRPRAAEPPPPPKSPKGGASAETLKAI